jgi:hypothetical protein
MWLSVAVGKPQVEGVPPTQTWAFARPASRRTADRMDHMMDLRFVDNMKK